MSKVVNTICDNCDSEFELKFNENLVKEHETLYCPFCNESLEESLEEDIEEDFDRFQEELWEE